jgi:hypothetical protein
MKPETKQAMTLANLFKRIESYYQRALQAYQLIKQGQGYFMPDDPEEAEPTTPEADQGQYNELFRAAQQVSDSSLSGELRLLAEMYKKTIEIGGGYNSINRAISNIINMYLEDESNPETEAVEDLLDNVVKDLRFRAGGQAGLNRPDSPQIVEQLKKVKNDFNNQEMRDEIQDLSQFDDKAVSVLDPNVGVKPLRDWILHYQNEQERYSNELENLNPNDRLTKQKLVKLMEILNTLIRKSTQAKSLETEIAYTPDPGKEAQLADLQQELSELKKERAHLGKMLRAHRFALQRNHLETELKKAKDPRAKFLLEQQLALNKTLDSQDYNRAEEVRLRKILISSMIRGGNSLGKDLQKLLAKIQEAVALKKPKGKDDSERAKMLREQKESKSLEGLIIDLRQKIANQKKMVKESATKKIKSSEHTIFQPYLNAIMEAKKSNNPMAIQAAVKSLEKAMVDQAENSQEVMDYIESTKAFYALRDQAQMIEKSQVLNTSGPINEILKAVIGDMIREGNDLVKRFEKTPYFGPVVKSTQAMMKLLEERINQQ